MKRIVLISIIAIIIFYYQIIKLNIFVFTAVSRGILTPNYFWWTFTDVFMKDNNGLNLYKDLKNYVSLNIFGTEMFLVKNIESIRQILDNSPKIFGVGRFKYNFFKTFMRYNVGISEGIEWKERRKLNEKVLIHDHLHKYANYHNNIIQTALSKSLPQNFKEFEEMSKKIIAEIVFNRRTIPIEIFEVFKEANSMRAVIDPDYKLPTSLRDTFRNFIWKELKNPRPNSLLSLCYKSVLKKEELIDQVPHWIFPLGGIVHSNCPRVLTYLCKNNNIMEKLKDELKQIDLTDSFAIYNAKYLRRCILETLRSNNPVTSTFRTLLEDFRFEDGVFFKKNTQFVILNNGVMRDESCFQNPNSFIPERWTGHKEKKYCSLMFSQGPQRCPGKELAIFLMSSFIAHYLKQTKVLDNLITLKCKVTESQMINPYSISFIFTSRA